MIVYPYTITAISKDSQNGSNIIPNAMISLLDVNGDAVNIYDDAIGSNGSSGKTADARGQVTVYVEAGEYTLTVNGQSNGNFIVSGDDLTLNYATFAQMASNRPVKTGQSFKCQERANAEYILQTSGYTALAGDVTFANGRVGSLQLEGGANAYIEWFTTPQSGLDRLNQNGGGTLYALGNYTLTDTLVLDGGGVKLSGTHPVRVFDNTVSVIKKSVFTADFTDGPMILISDGGCEISDIVIEGESSRRAATITTGAQNTNAGLLIEPSDNPSDILQSVIINNVKVTTQPADGILIEGDCTNIQLNNCYTMDCGRHGKAASSGDIGGRTNKKQCGIIMIKGGKSFDCDGHSLCIGHPSSSQFPYRVTVDNHEGYRCALSSSVSYSTAANFVVSQDSELRNCAFEGTTTGNVADKEGLEIGGRDNKITGCRYINCLGLYVIIRQQSGFSTENIEFDGGIGVSSATVNNFASIANGADGVSILRISHDCVNPITDIAYTSNSNDIRLHDLSENLTIHGNHTYDLSDSTVSGLKDTGLKVISSGAIEAPKDGYYRLDTEGSAATDTLVNITGGVVSSTITLRQENSGRVVTIDDGGGNIRLSGSSNYSFANTRVYITFIFDGANWQEISRSEN